jgi:hypothetical protein
LWKTHFLKKFNFQRQNITLNSITFPPLVWRLRNDEACTSHACTTSHAPCPCQGLSNCTKYVEREAPRFGRFMAWSHPNKQNRKNTDLNIQICYPCPPRDFYLVSAFLSAKKTRSQCVVSSPKKMSDITQSLCCNQIQKWSSSSSSSSSLGIGYTTYNFLLRLLQLYYNTKCIT